MINHEYPSNLDKYFDTDTMTMYLEAVEDIQKGREILKSYHEGRDNWHLLLTYGFMVDDGYFKAVLNLQLD